MCGTTYGIPGRHFKSLRGSLLRADGSLFLIRRWDLWAGLSLVISTMSHWAWKRELNGTHQTVLQDVRPRIMQPRAMRVACSDLRNSKICIACGALSRLGIFPASHTSRAAGSEGRRCI